VSPIPTGKLLFQTAQHETKKREPFFAVVVVRMCFHSCSGFVQCRFQVERRKQVLYCVRILITTRRRTLPSCGSTVSLLSRKLFHIILNGKPISCKLNAAGFFSLSLCLPWELACRAADQEQKDREKL